MSRSPHTPRERRLVGGLAVLTLVVVLGVCVLRREVRRAEAPAPAPSPLASQTTAPPTPRGSATRAEGLLGRSPVAAPSRWRVTARRAIDQYVAAAGEGVVVSTTEREELVATLARVRRASRAMQRLRPDHPLQAVHTRVLADADRRFHDALGVGVAEFVRALGPPDQVEDLGAVARR